MHKNYKNLIRLLLIENKLEAQSFTSLPDHKAVHTSAAGLGFYGTVSGKSWPEVYKKLQKEFSK